MSSDHSSLSDHSRLSSSPESSGKHKVKYQHDADWDFHLEERHSPIDLSLILPHYRARYQPVDHRMAMLVTGHTEDIKLKVCRPFPRSKFSLSVFAESSNVTIWLPSDFQGHIRFSPSCKTDFSAGFANKILRNVRLNEPLSGGGDAYQCASGGGSEGSADGDDVEGEEEEEEGKVTGYVNDDVVMIITRGTITFRMWDVQSGRPENIHKEALKRLFCHGASRKSPVPPAGIDWDCLLKD